MKKSNFIKNVILIFWGLFVLQFCSSLRVYSEEILQTVNVRNNDSKNEVIFNLENTKLSTYPVNLNTSCTVDKTQYFSFSNFSNDSDYPNGNVNLGPGKEAQLIYTYDVSSNAKIGTEGICFPKVSLNSASQNNDKKVFVFPDMTPIENWMSLDCTLLPV